ncbi:MAG TPA: TVP38/TMEM64 family protein [Firmicutes bacterium]|nr:TVP38/TMEM64 family protein [Bacillota bacterium]
MPDRGLARKIGRRLVQKAAGMIPILIGAAVFTGLLLMLLYLLTPFLPEQYQNLLQEVRQGDLTAGGESLMELLEANGSAKPLVFLIIQVLQVLLAPIPGQLIGLLGGYLFGFWYGLLLAMVGLGAGSLLAIGLGRLLGERLLRRFVPQAVLARFDYLITAGGLWNFFMLFLLPAFPDDAICFIAGLTRWPLWQLVAVCLLGRLPSMAVLIYMGASVGGDSGTGNFVFIISMAAAAVLWLFSEEVEEYFYRLGLSRRG